MPYNTMFQLINMVDKGNIRYKLAGRVSAFCYENIIVKKSAQKEQYLLLLQLHNLCFLLQL